MREIFQHIVAGTLLVSRVKRCLIGLDLIFRVSLKTRHLPAHVYRTSNRSHGFYQAWTCSPVVLYFMPSFQVWACLLLLSALISIRVLTEQDMFM